MEKVTVDIVSDVMCPWCIVGLKRFQAALASVVEQVSAEVRFHPFIMNPHLGEEGQNLVENTSQKYGISLAESEAGLANFVALGEEVGFTFRLQDDTRMYNTYKAHALLAWAGEKGCQQELEEALFSAHFTDNRAMDDSSVLVDIAESVGLEREQALQVINSEESLAQVKAEERLWREKGVNSVPAFIINGAERISGAQSVEVFREALLRAGSRESGCV